MIWKPYIGQKVQLHYAKATAKHVEHHGKVGTVLGVGKSKRCVNVAVRIGDTADVVIVPRGNVRIPANQ